MSKTDLKIPTVVEVKTTVGSEAPAQFSAIVCQRVWDRIAHGGKSILEACDLTGSGGPDFPLLTISLYQAEHGYGYGYIEGNELTRPMILIVGRSHRAFDLPMPTPPDGAGCFGTMKVGLVTLTRRVTSYIHELRDQVIAQGPARLRDGWELDAEELVKLTTRSAPDGLGIYSPAILFPERN